ncbi:RDD family protein [Flavobacterium sp. ACN6]|uniref:RDD family protein n=1 Tax=Flavobacterium sp. ACN6 TaxID=1920426 RepID=UPI000BB3D73B|nr:RDD family protein [Flavobacterium sp. ACN6]PBJ06596.1 RDD family protein [Flavobacterium sp. ACN6]
MYKKITLFSLFVSIIGIFLGFYRDYDSVLYIVLETFNVNLVTGLKFFNLDGYVWRLFFSLILLIGGLAYYFSKEKEVRLLRFMFSALFVQYSLFLILRFYNFFTFLKRDPDWKFYFGFVAATVVTIFVLYFLYKSLLYLNKLKELDYETFVYTESSEISYFQVNNWLRLFHLILDSMLFFLIAYQFIYFLMRSPYLESYLREIASQFSERTLLIILSVIFRTIFYFTFESLFGASPAKFLTESRVVDYLGDKPSNSSIFKRTLLRSVPFNAITFLFKANWHDSYSETQVCKEKRTGITGVVYFLIIPLFGISYITMNSVARIHEKNMMYKSGELTFQESNEKIQPALKILNSNSLLQLRNVDNDTPETKFLKVEQISDSEIQFLVFKLRRGITFTNLSIQKELNLAKDTLQKIKIKKDDLQKMILNSFEQSPEYYEDDKEEFGGISNNPILKGEYIDKVIELNSPDLIVFGISVSSSSLILQLQNQGIPAEVESINSNDAKIDWRKFEYYPKPFSIYGFMELKGVGDIYNYDLNVTVVDSLYRKFTYKISSKNDPQKATIRLVKR